MKAPPVPRAALLVAFSSLCLHLAFAGRYGWFRDELYFLACGRRLAWGFVDQPPLIALVSRLAFALGEGNLVLYRLPAALAHAGTVLLAGLFVQRLRGGGFAALVACLCVALAPVLQVFGYILTMNAFEPLLYLAVTLLVARLLQGGDERLWLGVGALTGLGLLNKHSFLFYAACLAAGIALSPQRRVLLSRWLAAGIGLAALMVLPHLFWQARNGFPMLELLSAQKWKNAPWSLSGFLIEQVLELNPLAFPVAAAGAVLLWRELRPLALASLLQILLFGALRGKAYYLASAYLPLYTAGGVLLERFSSRWRLAIPALLVASGLLEAPLVLPVLSPEALARYQQALGVAPARLENKRYGPLPQHLADQFGWHELAAAVAIAAAQLSAEERAHAAVYTQNYGEAGALELLGPGLPVVSGHNSYYLWGPPRGAQAMLVVGGKQADHLRSVEEVRVGAEEADAPFAMPYERELTIWICRRARQPIEAIWPRVKHYE